MNKIITIITLSALLIALITGIISCIIIIPDIHRHNKLIQERIKKIGDKNE